MPALEILEQLQLGLLGGVVGAQLREVVVEVEDPLLLERRALELGEPVLDPEALGGALGALDLGLELLEARAQPVGRLSVWPRFWSTCAWT